jgi:hypothetical protein
MDRRRRLVMDALEGRELLSITPLIGSPTWVHSAAAGTGGGSGAGQVGSGSGSSMLSVDPATGAVVNGNLGGSGLTTDLSPPRPNEVNRRMFTATFGGRVQELPPRLLDQSRQFFILGPGTTNQFLHGTLQMRYYTPNPVPITIADPANPDLPLTELVTVTTGTISMSDRSTQSGGVILGNLTGNPADVDARGRPTHFDLNLNGGGGSGGMYASSTGSGTVDIAYKGNRATVRVRASIFIQGVGNPLNIFQTSHH